MAIEFGVGQVVGGCVGDGGNDEIGNGNGNGNVTRPTIPALALDFLTLNFRNREDGPGGF